MFRTILLLFTLALFSELPAQSLHLLTQSDGDVVRLRWAVDDAKDWLWANDNGYTISRLARKVNGQTLSVGDQAASRTVLFSNVRPLAETEWAADDLSQAAKQLLYSSDWDVENTGTFAGVVEAEENLENQLFFAHALAERDFQLATRLALGATDNNPAAGTEYVYVITVNGLTHEGRPLNAGAKGGLGQGIADLAPVTGLLVESGDTSVRVGWSTEATEHLYTSYDIFRAPAGNSAFTKANEAPYFYGATGPDDPKLAVFTDSIATYGDYDYYVVGRTPFGFFGTPSDTISASSRPNALNIRMRLDSVVATETALTLHWPSVSDEHNNTMVAQRIYRAANVKSTYELVTDGSLGISDRAWTDEDPLVSAYYIIELEDENGHLYRTQPQLGQLEDQTPPATPVGFAGEDLGDGSLVLTWDKNTESDFKGYRLFRCYARGGEFAVVGPDIITDTTFTDNLRGIIVNDSIFYRLHAEDGRANASTKTPVLIVARVDITPPGKPTLARINATPAGIAVDWEYSADDDIVRHELQRRLNGTRDWTTVVTVAAGSEDDYLVENFEAAGSVNYVDESQLPRGEYDYQFLAFDDAGLGAGSEIVTLRPHDSGERGEIRDLAVGFTCADSTVTTGLDEARNQSISNFLSSFEDNQQVTDIEFKSVFQAMEMSGWVTSTQFAEWQDMTPPEVYEQVKELYAENGPQTKRTNCTIQLEWGYQLDPSIQHFQVYRSRRESRLRPYVVLPLSHFYEGPVPTGSQSLSYTDTDVQPGVRYVYKVMAVHKDGGFSREGSGVTVVVE